MLGAVFEGQRPAEASFNHRGMDGGPVTELGAWNPVPQEVQHVIRNSPSGIFSLEWRM